MSEKKKKIAGIILAGGTARRMGSINKGAQILFGDSLFEHVYRNVSKQVDEVFISANEYAPYYQDYGCEVLPDKRPGHLGPLSGIETILLNHPEAEWFFCTPVDTPFIPLDLVDQLYKAVVREGLKAAFPIHNEIRHPLHCLIHRSLLPSLTEFLDRGERSAGYWLRNCQAKQLTIDGKPNAFSNINTIEELTKFNSKENSMIGFNEIYPLLDQWIEPTTDIETIPLAESLGFILAEDIKSPLNVPQFDNSAMDGWALSSKDIQQGPFTLTEVGSSFAGHPFDQKLESGQCIRIMTGGEVPEGADTVVKQEIVTAVGKSITFPAGIRAGDNVRRKAEEFSVGDVVLQRGTKIHAPQLSFLAVLGISEVTVFRKIRVAFFSTGDELQPLGTPLSKGHIYDSNRYSIGAMLKELGFEIFDMGIIPDNPEEMKKALEKAADCADAIVTSGGVSVGKADFTRSSVEELGSIQDWTIKMRPGKPLALGKIGDSYFFGLPGNPTAAQVTFYMIVSHALKLLSGQVGIKLPITRAKCKGALRKRVGYTEFQRGVLSVENGEVRVQSAGSQKTGAMRSMVVGECFILLSETCGPVEDGDPVDVIPFFGVCC